MLRFFGWLLGAVIVLAFVLLTGAWWLLNDPDRLRPQLLERLEAETGVPVRIDGGLGWRLIPPLALYAERVSADRDGVHYELRRLDLDVDLASVVASRDMNRWRIRSLKLDDLNVAGDADTVRVHELVLSDFALNRLSHFETRLTRYVADEPPLPLHARGQLLYQPDERVVRFVDTRVETDYAHGVCNAEAAIGDAGDYVGAPDELLPVEVWRGYDWRGSCLFDDVELDGERFRNVRLESANDDGNSSTTAMLPHFFGGSAVVDVDVNAQQDPIVWRITPNLKNVDSQALMGWLDQRLTWAAPLAYGGSVTMAGNTEQELVRSLKGTTHFDGGQGTIDISRVKTPLANLAALIKEDARIRTWPELWHYQHLAGDWEIDGTRHLLTLALDNLNANFDGTVDPLNDALDMRIDLKVDDAGNGHGFDVGPLLTGIPIPLRCLGTLKEPKCAVDQDSARRIAASALAADDGEFKSKLERKIDTDVPEEYRETARGLLDAFTRTLKNQRQER